MQKITVMLIDDNDNVRQGLKRMLGRSPQVEVIGETGDGSEALILAETLNPDVLLLDVEMPGMKGYEVARQLVESGSEARIIALSGYYEPHHIIGMFINGAAGYLTKDEAPDKLVGAIQEIASGFRGWISPKVAKKLGIPPRPIGQDTIPKLTSAERQILKCIVQGKTDTEIKIDLDLELEVVKNNIQSIFQKLKVKSRSEAILRSIQEDIV